MPHCHGVSVALAQSLCNKCFDVQLSRYMMSMKDINCNGMYIIIALLIDVIDPRGISFTFATINYALLGMFSYFVMSL